MSCRMLPLKWVTMFLVTWCGIGCDNFNELFIEDKNEYSYSTGMAINFVIKNISANDIHIVATESFFIRNYTAVTMKWSHVSFTILNIERHFNVLRKYPSTAVLVLFLDTHFHQLRNNLTKLWHRTKKNKVIAVGNNCMEWNTVADYFALTWSMHFLKFILLNNCNDTVDAYTYFPFASNSCRIYTASNIIKLGSFLSNPSNNSEIQFEPQYEPSTPAFSMNSLPFFPDKIPLNLNRCPVKISTGNWPPNVINITSVDEAGIEMEFVKLMEHQLNCDLSIRVYDGLKMGLSFGENAEPTGRMSLLKNEMYDLLFGAVPAIPNVFRDFDTTDCFLPNQLKFIVPTAGSLPNSMILWTVLEKHTTLLAILLVVVFLQSICIKWLHRLSYKGGVRTQNERCFIAETFVTLLRSLIETSTPTLPDNKVIRWVYGIWFGSCLIISCFFTTTLTAFFAEPGHVKQLKTISDIITSQIPLSINELYYPVLSADPEEMKYFLSKNANASVPIGLKLASMGDAATFTDVLRARHISVQWVSWYGDSSIYYIGGNRIMSYWNVMISYKGNPLMQRINDIMQRINESGFWNFQVNRYYNKRLIRTMIRQYLIVYNFQHAINNTNAINQFNEGFTDSLPLGTSETVAGKLLLETNEEDIIRRFGRSQKTLITWDHLSTVFVVWSIGMGVGVLTFLFEFLNFRLMKIIA